MKTLLTTAILLVTGAALLCGCERERQAPVQPSGKTIKVGIIAPFSGSDFSKGQEGLNGIKTAIAMRPLLDNGDRVELVIKDDQNDPAKSAALLAELTQIDQVAAVVTFSSSGPVLAMAREADLYKTPIIAVLATHPDVTTGNDYVSQVCFDNTFQGRVAAFFVREELLVDQVAIFRTPTNVYSSNLAAEFQRQFAALGGEVTDVVDIRGGETHLSDILARVREKDPELLYMPIAAKDLIAIMQTVDQMGWKPMEMASDGLLATVFSQYTEHLGLLEGLLATEFFHQLSQNTEFFKRAAKVHQGGATSYTAMGLEGFSILLDAMSRCDDAADRACINQQIRSTTEFEGLMGNIAIDSKGKAHRPVIINAIINNRLKYIVKVY